MITIDYVIHESQTDTTTSPRQSTYTDAQLAISIYITYFTEVRNMKEASKHTIPRRPSSSPSSLASSSSSSLFIPCCIFICSRMICRSRSTSLRLISSSCVRIPWPTKSRCLAMSPLCRQQYNVSHSTTFSFQLFIQIFNTDIAFIYLLCPCPWGRVTNCCSLMPLTKEWKP